MLKVILVDDEPYILQGLKVIIDWEGEGFSIEHVFSNGADALKYLTDNEVDLVISDIKMPEMTGLELLEIVKKEKISDAEFVLLTGYDDFTYTQQAIRNGCLDYILKPVNEEDLVAVLRKVSNKNRESVLLRKDREKLEDAYLSRIVRHLVNDKYSEEDIDYLKEHLQLSGELRFIDIEYIDRDMETDEDNKDDYYLSALQKRLYYTCREVLKDNANHFTIDFSYDEDNYNVGFLYCTNMASIRGMGEDDFLKDLMRKISALTNNPVRFLCGKKVSDISSLSESYRTCRSLMSITGFHTTKRLYIYEEADVTHGNFALCKNTIDEIVGAIERNDVNLIDSSIDKLYEELQGKEGSDLNINYLLFQLIHLASEQDDSVNQEEIIQYISEQTSEKSFVRGGSEHFKKFAKEYAVYLTELRKSISHGLLSEVEADIRKNYADNISLKDLGDKYHINSSYLGQLFKKKYGTSFKNYLTNYRIREAAKLIVTTDKKINRIAEDVGYKDSDYFISKFIEIMGCTPSKYRKTNGGTPG